MEGGREKGKERVELREREREGEKKEMGGGKEGGERE